MTDPRPTARASAAPAGRGGRLRTLLPLAVAAWLVLEIWLALEVASVLGGLAVAALFLAGALVGGWTVKRAGLRALRSAARSVEQGREPEAGESHTALTITGGVLLILPGFLSDLLGLACLFPPTRALLRRVPVRLARAAVRRGRAGDPLAEALRLQEQLRVHRPGGRVVPGEVVDRDGGPGGASRDDARPPRTVRILPPEQPPR
ncbi:FxsA family protein [Streptacidiphilus sp. ASG 303]|uniref:FxsA family membrane protein n=1 Tax=Streptacidiphilus sp. ASG 303 TaxID=2896847 RepID=UPI001E62F8BC|nr:FxsA family membrane protein [Streptacidiphilus sp. ASG 303]MCD0481150.1 FxsA family protein [Streptacidiphilus sp. ASG 303]